MASNETHLGGRYAVHGVIAAGGMATIHYGRLFADGGFARIVAIKRLHARFASDRELVAMLVDEARLAARIQHPNVVPVIDVVREGELSLVMEYVAGESLARLVQAAIAGSGALEPPVAVAIASGMLRGLHAAHETKDEAGRPLGIVHRDVSPQNVLVGADGVVRVVDFGIAKAVGRFQRETQQGVIKGKVAYMAPEQLRAGELDRRADIYAAGVVLWEMLAGRRLFASEDEATLVARILQEPPPRLARSDDDRERQELDGILQRALAKDRDARFCTALEMALAFERVVAPATPSELAAWVETNAGDVLAARALEVAAIERRAAAVPAVDREGDGLPHEGTKVVQRARRGRATAEPAAAPVAVAETKISAGHPERPKAALGRRWTPIATALVAGAAVATALTLAIVRREPRQEPTTETSAEPATIASAGEAPVEITSATPLSSDAPAPRQHRRSSHGQAAPSKRSASPRSCDPPYYWDPDGHKRFRPECIQSGH